MKLWVFIRVGVMLLVLAAKRGWLAARIYLRELSSGSKPSQAIRTALAACVGIARPPAEDGRSS